MPYDPQRSHRRPQLADDAAAPIDALLGDTDAPVEPALADDGSVFIENEIEIDDEIEVIGVGDRGRPRVALLVIALVVLLLVVAWVRRRAPKR